METRRRSFPEFTSALTKRELICAAVALVMQVFLFPLLMSNLMAAGALSESMANFLMYAVMALYTLIYAWGFLRRDFDPLADRPLAVICDVIGGYLIMTACNTLTAMLLTFAESTQNPNNEAVIGLVSDSGGMMSATVIFFAPIVEEVLFRGGIFGFLRKYNRAAAYIVTVVAFSFYHLWAYVLQDTSNLIYLAQYIPAGIILCRIYERDNTIWAPIGMHMLVNYISVQAIEMLA